MNRINSHKFFGIFKTLWRDKHQSDLLFNYLALSLLAVSGILINFILGIQYGPEGPGVFNQFYVVFLIVCQLATAGLHNATLKYAAEFENDVHQTKQLIHTAVFITLPFALIVSMLISCLGQTYGLFFKHSKVGLGLVYLGPGIFLFAVNKVLLGVLNGQHQMKAFACVNALRFILILVLLSIFSLHHYPIEKISMIFMMAEGALLIVLWGIFAKFSFHIQKGFFDFSKIWLIKYFHFIKKGFLSGLLFEVNLRVDILFVSFFMDDSAVGIYSFALYFAEGMLAVINVIRNQVNPLLVRYFKQSNFTALHMLIKTTRIYLYPICILGLILIFVLYQPILTRVMGNTPFLQSYVPLMILLSALVLVCGFLPFDAILLQSGHVGLHTLLLLSVLLSNGIFQILLLPRYGIIGAALGSGLTYLFGAVYLTILSKKVLHFDLIRRYTHQSSHSYSR